MPEWHDATAKEAQLGALLAESKRVLLGYSGGVDSSFLAAVAVERLGADNVLGVLGLSESVAAEQHATARAVAQQIGLTMVEVETRELADPRYAANPSNRCYYCKTELWGVLRRLALERGYGAVIDGSNADDAADWRPGASAAREHSVTSPLAIVGLRKAEIRLLARARGLPIWDAPSSPCLASRLAYGTTVTPERLSAVERAERALRSLGVTGELRVRHHGDLARVELSPSVLDEWLDPARAPAVVDAVRSAGFERVAIDLRGYRSGSLNVLEGVVAA
ncbi:MAG TPA: ATP-dependent sacrificial sulfur transferase LarE [Gemmatimonadaceae bacterium]|nr:ATP-dependent sacrificial sulfur transferase LarE [Gemmatimonadaceae bacterium]